MSPTIWKASLGSHPGYTRAQPARSAIVPTESAMPQSSILQLVLAFSVMAFTIFAFGDSNSPAWWWATITGAALAAVVGVDGWAERKTLLAPPLSGKSGLAIATRLVLPVLVLVAVAAAWGTGDVLWRDVVAVLAVALAIASLL